MAENRIGIVGLGVMGSPIAGHLLDAGWQVSVWNRTASKAGPLVDRGARQAGRPEDVTETGGIVLSMLADDSSVEQAAFGDGGFGARLGPGGLHISMSTISPAAAASLSARHAALGTAYVATPVFGRPVDAAERRLRICVSGSEEAKQRARPILEILGQNIVDFGEAPGAANVAKLCGNFLLMTALESIAEALTLAEKNGVDPVAVTEILPFVQGAITRFGKTISERNHDQVGFRLALGLKDAGLVRKTAKDAGAVMPFADVVQRRFERSVEKGRAELDWSALALDVAEESGLQR